MKPRALSCTLISFLLAGELLATAPPAAANPFAILGAVKAFRAVTSGGGGHHRAQRRNASRNNDRGPRARNQRDGGDDRDAYRQGYRDALGDSRSRFASALDEEGGDGERGDGGRGGREGRGRRGHRNR